MSVDIRTSTFLSIKLGIRSNMDSFPCYKLKIYNKGGGTRVLKFNFIIFKIILVYKKSERVGNIIQL